MTLINRRSARAFALVAAIGALAVPSASAAPVEQFMPDTRADSEVVAMPVRVIEVGSDPGFDWGDAGIGASGLLALMAIGAGAAVATGHRPGMRHNPQTIR